MSAIVILKRNVFALYLSDKGSPLVGQVSAQAVTDMEVVDEKRFRDDIVRTLGNAIPKPSVPTILLLSDELCFVNKLAEQPTPEVLQKLTSVLPFAHAESVVLHTNDGDFALSANADLYHVTARLLTERGFGVSYVIPWAAITRAGISVRGELDKVTVKKIFDAQASLKQYAFPLDMLPVISPKPTSSPQTTPRKRIPMGWILFVSIALIYALVMLWFFVRGS